MAADAYAAAREVARAAQGLDARGARPASASSTAARRPSRARRCRPETLRPLNEQLLRMPDGFTVHRKLKPQLERRRKALEDEGTIDWAQAESLAWGSLLLQNVPIGSPARTPSAARSASAT